MDYIIYFKENKSLKEEYSLQRLSYTRRYTNFFATIYNQIGKIISEYEDLLLYYFVDELTQIDQIRIKNIVTNYPKVKICMCAPEMHALSAWKLNVFHFEDTVENQSVNLSQAYKKYVINQGGQSQELVIKKEDGILRIPFGDITYFKADGNYTHIFLKKDKKLLQTKQLGQYMHLTEADLNLVRIHRSIIINLKNVKTVWNSKIYFYHCEQALLVSLSLEKKIKRLLLGKL